MAAAGDAEDLAMIDRLLTRLALTEDAQLEKVLSKLLPLAISRLGSTHAPMRIKVMEMLNHINKRVKDQLSIKLPLKDLLKMYKSPDTKPTVKNVSIIYVEMAFDHASAEERAEVAPDFLVGIAQARPEHQAILLRMASKGLEKYSSGRIEDNLAKRFTFIEESADCREFLEFSQQIMLYQPVSSAQGGAPPGLSAVQAARISRKDNPRGVALMTRKLGILNFVAELDLGADLVYTLYLVASVDSNESVAKRGEELLKRKAAGANLEDPTLIKKLFSRYLGSQPNPAGSASGNNDDKVAPAGPALKARLMGAFTHSIVAANQFPLTLQCVFDCISGAGTTSRLKQAGMEFSVWIFKHAEDRQLKVMAPIMLTSVIKLLTDPSESDASSKQQRAFCYQAIGQLAQRAPHLFSGNTEMVVRLFDALRTEHVNLRSSVQEALASLAGAYKGCTATVATELEALLLKHVHAVESEARFCAVSWATKWNTFSHVPSRYICMIGAADTKLDIREMAQQGLAPPKSDKAGVELTTTTYPSLKEMMDYICKQQPRVPSPAPLGEQLLLFSAKTYVAMIEFLQKCFEAEQNNSSDNASSESQSSRMAAKDAFRLLLEHGMAHDGTVELHTIASKGILALATIDHESMANTYKNRLPWLKQFVGHVDSTTREAIGRLLGICTISLTSSEAADLLKDLVSSYEVDNNKRRFEDIQGAVCATGFVLAQCLMGTPEVPRPLMESTISVLISKITSGNDFLAGSAAEALGHAGLRGPLPIALGDFSSTPSPAVPSGSSSSELGGKPMDTSSVEAVTSATVSTGPDETLNPSKQSGEKMKSEEVSLALAVKNISGLLACKEVKMVQKAVISLGQLCYGSPKSELLNSSLSALFTLSKSKAEDVLFSIGEALSFIWGGVPISADKILKTDYVSLSSSTNFLNEDGPAQGGDIEMEVGQDETEREPARERIVKKLFDELLFSGRTDERCAGCVWLVSIISYSGRHARVQKMLPEIQEALSHLLGDVNDLTQEMASRGMSIVYELGDSSTKDELVTALVNNLSGTAKKKRAVKLLEESEVFAEGALGEKPGGGNISTYKELCSIANEMGQPDLIYKFMDLANHQASLNSKRGAAFGFARIAKQAGEALKPHLPALVPKLLRYQYDPNKRIQDAMGHIWRALVAEPKKTTDELFDDIMEDLLTQAGSRLWRSRESSCLALADVLQGRRYNEVGKYLARTWTMAFRSIDDIKETVRLAGGSLCRAVNSLTLRLCDTTLTAEADAKATMAIVLPFLLSKGILSSVEDVRQISVAAVMKLVKGAGKAVRPQMPDLVVCMLESLSSLEDQRLSYIEMHAERAGINTEKLENVRIAGAKDSPMWDTLDFCLRHVDNPTLELLVPRLIQLVRSGVGLNTRAGVARFINQLAMRVGFDLKPHSGALLKVLFSAVKSEKSVAAKRAFANACGAVAKYAGEPQIEWLLTESVALYTSGTDKDAHMACALVLEQSSLQANEILKGHYALVLPIAFIGRFDEEEEISRRFEELWEENTSGGAALQLYMPEIVKFLREGISSSSWPQKKKTAKATAYLAEKAGESVGTSAPILLTDLLGELPGRLWEGKEAILDSIGTLTLSCPQAILSGSATTGSPGPDVIVRDILAACGRKKGSYRGAAFNCLEAVLKAFKGHDLLEQILPVLVEESMQPPARKAVSDGTLGTGTDEPKESTAAVDKVMACLSAGLKSAALASTLAHGKTITEALVSTLGQGHSWQVKLASLTTVKVFLEKLGDCLRSTNDGSFATIKPWLESLVPPILDCISNVKVLQVHTAALEALIQILEVSNLGSGLENSVSDSLVGRLQEAQGLEKNAAAKSLIIQAMDLLRTVETPMQE
ncbi:unnamed protein product [Calypogeia fissa]